MKFKTKTFEDLIPAAQLMLASGRTEPQCLSMEVPSVRGFLVGAVDNMGPDLFRDVVSGVLFMYVVFKMLDAFRLTMGKWQAWGTLHTRKCFYAISAYLTYTKVDKKAY